MLVLVWCWCGVVGVGVGVGVGVFFVAVAVVFVVRCPHIVSSPYAIHSPRPWDGFHCFRTGT